MTKHDNHMTTAPEPVWEVICSGGLRVVADHGNMSESLLRTVVREILREVA